MDFARPRCYCRPLELPAACLSQWIALVGQLARREEIRSGQRDSGGTRVGSLEEQIGQLRAEMRSEFSAVRQEMRALNEETRRQTLVLHEVLIARIAALQNGLPPRRARKKSH